MPSGLPHILLAEEDASHAQRLHDLLQSAGYLVRMVSDGIAALDIVCREYFHLCVVSVTIPRMDGFTLVQNMRNANRHVPVIFLTSNPSREERLKGYRCGGDDFISKPFDIEELILRIKVFLKRNERRQPDLLLSFGQSSYDPLNHVLHVNGQTVQLTAKESGILHLLARNKNNLVLREMLQKEVWGSTEPHVNRSMDVYLCRLRKYLTADHRVDIINHHGLGFMLKES